MLAQWNSPRALEPVPTARGAQPRKLVSLLAHALAVPKTAVRALLGHVGYDLGALRRLSLVELGALPGMTPDAAEKLFYLVQWEGVQAHLELHGSLPERAKLGPLLDVLTPIFERHFETTDRLSAEVLRRYRAQLAAQRRSCWGQRPCLEGLPRPARARLLTWLGF